MLRGSGAPVETARFAIALLVFDTLVKFALRLVGAREMNRAAGVSAVDFPVGETGPGGFDEFVAQIGVPKGIRATLYLEYRTEDHRPSAVFNAFLGKGRAVTIACGGFCLGGQWQK